MIFYRNGCAGDISCSNAGCSRSVTMALAYVIQNERIGLKEALTRLKQTRPAARPNDGFMKQLEHWEHLTFNEHS